ncbi:MAG: hypothetical protein WBB67_02050 [bacterium]
MKVVNEMKKEKTSRFIQSTRAVFLTSLVQIDFGDVKEKKTC